MCTYTHIHIDMYMCICTPIHIPRMNQSQLLDWSSQAQDMTHYMRDIHA